MKLAVIITQEDIDKGEPVRSTLCPIARAATRAAGAPMAMGADVLREEEGLRAAIVPYKVVQWRRNFDAGQPVQPMEFEVELREKYW